MRRVKVFTWEPAFNKVDQKSYLKKIDYGTAMFHGFGVDFESTEFGPGNYSVAIIERPDGSVESVSVDLIHFIDPVTERDIGS